MNNEKARQVIGQKWSKRWSELVSDELGRLIDAKPSQEELLDFLSDFRRELAGAQDQFTLQLFLYWLERRVDRTAGLIQVAGSSSRQPEPSS